MYYERLMRSYHKSGCSRYYSEALLDKLDKYVTEQVNLRREYINPYKFSDENKIGLKDSLGFLMYFVSDEGPLDIEFFIDCSTPTCYNRIIIGKDILEARDPDESVICTECSKEYFLSDISQSIKTYLVIKSNQQIADYSDPNSTFQALKGLPGHLKSLSPSSLSNNKLTLDEGATLSLTDVLHANTSQTGEVISPYAEQLLHDVINILGEYDQEIS